MSVHKIIEKIKSIFTKKAEEVQAEFREKKADFLQKIEGKKHLYDEFLAEASEKRKSRILTQIESKKFKKIQALQSEAVHSVMDGFFDEFLLYLQQLSAEKKEQVVQKIANSFAKESFDSMKIECNRAEKDLYQKHFPSAEIVIRDEIKGGAVFSTEQFLVDYRLDFLLQQKKDQLQLIFSRDL